MIRLFAFSTLSLFLLFSSSSIWTDEQSTLHRIYAHLTIQDHASAAEEGLQALKQFPHEKKLWQATLKALARTDQETLLFELWNRYQTLFPEAKKERRIQELLAWAVIEKANRSTLPLMRIRAMLAAFFSQDAKGVALLAHNLNDRNLIIRAVAIEIASHLRDAQLQEKILEILKREQNWKLRLPAIKAIGKMGIESARPDLVAIIGSPQSRAEEKAAAAESYIQLMQKVRRQEIIKLVSSDRAALRALACQLAAHGEMSHAADLIIPLLNDHSAEVRAAALQTCGLLRIDPAMQSVRRLIQDHDPLVAISAAWLLTLYQPEEGQKAFQQLLNSSQPEMRLLASGGLSATGQYGLPLLEAAFESSREPFVRLNLALGLINQRINVTQASDAIADMLYQDHQRWAWDKRGIFRILRVSQKNFNADEEVTPETHNQLVRLEVLNLLAVLHNPRALDCIKQFLQERYWGISGMAAALLLTEGDEDALALVEQLLQDPNARVRVQAACILALWGRGDNVIEFLQQAYNTADRLTRERILEALGHIASNTSIPFFVERLQEPSPALRILAAQGLLQCLYH